jgi:L-2-hydroxyglutarate oxidase
MASPMDHHYVIIGGGIVGLATARELVARDPSARIVLLEKEEEFGLHQTGHNSGVIHAGLYYQPGSLKARLCREGAEATKQFCRDSRIDFETCGKLIVATSPLEVERLQALAGRAGQNGIEIHPVSGTELARIEPNVHGLEALLVPTTGIVDYRRVCLAIAQRLREAGVDLHLGARVTGIVEDETGVTVTTGGGDSVRAERLIACAGLQSDRIALMTGLDVRHRIVPFRGEYYTLPAEKSAIVRHLIYPVPDPDLPFLGIHLTRMIDGRVTVGPNAVLGFSREGYERGSVNLSDVGAMVGFAGFWTMARRNLRSGISEFRNSLMRKHYLEECRKYCPSLTLVDLGRPGCGIRAQAVLEDGTLVQDFLFLDSALSLHVCNAPSPAATSAMPIARMIVDRMEQAA